MNTYNDFRTAQAAQNTIVYALGDKLNAFPKNENGLVEMTPEYRIVKAKFDAEFKKLQSINSFGVKNFKKEIAQARKVKRGLIV